MLCSGEIMHNPWAVEASHALLWGSQHGLQPVWEAAAPGLGVHRLQEELLWREPYEAFPSSSLKLCIPSSAACSKVVDGSFVDLPVNLVFLHGLGAQWGKFGFQTPAWFHSYPYDQQMELREYCFLEEKEMDFLQFLTWNWSSTSSPVLFFPLLISC